MLDSALMQMMARIVALERTVERMRTLEVPRRPIAEAVGTGASGVLEFTGIPASFRNLVVSFVGRSTAAADYATVQLTFETSPTAGAYDHQNILGQAGVASAGENIGASNSIEAGYLAANTSSANVHGGGRIYLPEYANTGIFKAVSIVTHGGSSLVTARILTEVVAGIWESTAAIDRIRLTLSGGSWTTTSRATLYGEPAP